MGRTDREDRSEASLFVEPGAAVLLLLPGLGAGLGAFLDRRSRRNP